MKGSLESPPIVIRTSRPFSFIGFIVCVAVMGLGLAPVLLGGVPFRIGDHFLSLGFGMAALYFAWQLLLPSALVAGPDGLAWRHFYMSRHWQWRDVSNFRIVQGLFVGCDLADHRSAVSWLRPINKTMTGSQGSFLFGWEGGSKSVVAILTEARKRWL